MRSTSSTRPFAPLMKGGFEVGLEIQASIRSLPNLKSLIGKGTHCQLSIR